MVVPESSINNIMGGLESTGGVTLHNHRRKLKQRFETIAKLGQGTYGKVQLGINKETGQEVAIKTIKKCKIETEADLIRIRREIQIMSSLRHPYIIHIYEVFENRDKMVLVMEYAAGGELYDYLSKRKVLDEQEARRIFRQISMAVYYCHKHQICHRDLKLENILLDEQGNAKIADFGLSNVFDKSRLLSTFCGSPLYASPEIVKGIPYYGPEVDCWSMGVLLYTLVYGAMPFDGSNFKRLVRQISAGEYFEPKTPSTASDLIAGLLTVKGTDRLDITGVCQHSWMAEEGKVSCYRLAVELAEQEPNRLDLLLALAPQENQIPSVPEEMPAPQQSNERPSRSMSLSSLPTVQPSFTAPIPSPVTSPAKAQEDPEKPPEKEKKRERSSSRTRKKESDDEKPKKKTAKTKKKSDPELTKEEMEKVLEEAKKLSEIIAQTPVSEAAKVEEPTLPGVKPADLPKTEEAVSLPQRKPSEPKEEPKEKPKEVKKVKKVKQDKKDEGKKDEVPPARSPLKKEKEVDIPDKEVESMKAKAEDEELKGEVVPKVQKELGIAPKEVDEEAKSNDVKEVGETKEPASPFRRDSVRRKSKVFETAEMFTKSPTQEKLPQKKVFLPGVKVSDAKAAFERRSSISQETKPEFSLASTINVNKLIQNELNKENKENKDDEKLKKENAVKVISHAISESGMNKASTLPRRKLSKPSLITRSEPEHMVANTSVSQVVYPTAPSTPVPPPRPSLSKQDSGPREHIIPIQIEKRDDKPPPVSKQASLSSRTSSVSSIGRQDSDSSTTTIGTPTLSGSCEPIRKSPREVIIPIAVEGGGFITPSASTLSKMSSLSEGEDEEQRPGPMRGFGLHSTRRRVEATDSLSSDDEEDNFEVLTPENLFSTLLSRVRNLTYRLNENEGRPNFPRLFNHSLFDSPTSRRRLTETKSFSEHDPTPWRRKRETTPSSTLPRGFTARSFRRTLTGGDENRREGRPPPAASSSASLRNRKRSEDEVVEDFLATGKLSSLDRVRSYLEGLRRPNVEASPSPLRRYLSESPRTDYPPIPRSRQSSLDASSRTDRYSSYINEDRNLFDEQKKTSRTQSDVSCSTQNGDSSLTNSTKECNGFYENRYSYPRLEYNENLRKSLERSYIPRGPEKVTSISDRLTKIPKSQVELDRDIVISNKIPRKIEKTSKKLTNMEEGDKTSNEVKKSLEPTIDNILKDVETTGKKIKSTDKVTKLKKKSDCEKTLKNSEHSDKVQKNSNVSEKVPKNPDENNISLINSNTGENMLESPETNSKIVQIPNISDKVLNSPDEINKTLISPNNIDNIIKNPDVVDIVVKRNDNALRNKAKGDSLPGPSENVSSSKSFPETEMANGAELNKVEDSHYLNSEVNEKSKRDLKKGEKVSNSKKDSKKDKNGSRINKAINALRKKSETYENAFTESKLLKRAVSLEDLRTDEECRSKRASSLKPEGSFEKKDSPKAKRGGVFDTLNKKKEDREARIANLKRLDLVKGGVGEISAESTPTGDQDEQESMVSATDNSDTWSSCDLGERLTDPNTEECVLERIRRKSFYHRFNLPKRQVYNRSLSNMERKRYY